MLTRKAKLLLSLGAATPLLFAACKDNSLLGPYGDVAGTYQLTVFQGRTLPVTYTYAPGAISALPNGGTITWTDGTMVLRSDGSFTETNNYVITPSGGTAQSNAFVSIGTYTVNGSAFTLSAPAQGNVTARFASGTLDLDTLSYVEDNGDGTTSSYEYKL
jgi:hypothetical protein